MTMRKDVWSLADPIPPITLADLVERVSEHLGIEGDAMVGERLVEVCEAASRWVENRRSLTNPDDLWNQPDVIQGTVLYAGLLYTSRAQPQGMPGLDDVGSYSEDVGVAMSQVYRLVGSDPVVA